MNENVVKKKANEIGATTIEQRQMTKTKQKKKNIVELTKRIKSTNLRWTLAFS